MTEPRTQYKIAPAPRRRQPARTHRGRVNHATIPPVSLPPEVETFLRIYVNIAKRIAARKQSNKEKSCD